MIAICIRARVIGFDAPHARYAAYVRAQDIRPDIAAIAFPAPAERLWKGAGLAMPFYAFLPPSWASPGRLPPAVIEQIVYAAGEAAREWSRAMLAAAFPETAKRRDMPLWVPCDLPDACERAEETAGLAERRMAARWSLGSAD